ncbi:MAG: hypothetical protein MJY69_02075 [Bacteroidales bacterium]|nr:hypothetical protein [Bacteroidales bacterium]
MADNYLEKRYSEVFGSGNKVDPETGYASAGKRERRAVPVKIRKAPSRKPGNQ